MRWCSVLAVHAGCLLFISMLSGCGFQLRTVPDTPQLVGTYSLEVRSPYPDIRFVLENTLRARGFGVVAGVEGYIVQITEERFSENEIGLDKELPLPYRFLTYELEYQVFESGLTEIISDTITESTDYSFAEGNYLQQQKAHDLAVEALRKRAAIHLANKLIEIVN